MLKHERVLLRGSGFDAGEKKYFGLLGAVMRNEFAFQNVGTGAVSYNKTGAVAKALFYVHIAQ